MNAGIRVDANEGGAGNHPRVSAGIHGDRMSSQGVCAVGIHLRRARAGIRIDAKGGGAGVHLRVNAGIHGPEKLGGGSQRGDDAVQEMPRGSAGLGVQPVRED